ncbi:C2H2-type zinc finger protein NDAI_0B03080 [Naumovozyma dairenensis CBS 421]|uniref:C2H2-type domain-containing protein n=1 Tax=Naumovozyma dairenensis (strain ATCC 10597 / BCRC 20456 / CBS 421 / NBRC 0211 / NRRL Y-12639) TaxID=1071378 RepID=G0W6D2_NAUDC|nr:hypothetical protein NDAI_0B03080 [Naumovozyma dairenensis CBS 421]CCD23343.1 hypothetical protein NDAI_0B03080 [Naumovozyma dairenensis CBS 421]
MNDNNIFHVAPETREYNQLGNLSHIGIGSYNTHILRSSPQSIRGRLSSVGEFTLNLDESLVSTIFMPSNIRNNPIGHIATSETNKGVANHALSAQTAKLDITNRNPYHHNGLSAAHSRDSKSEINQTFSNTSIDAEMKVHTKDTLYGTNSSSHTQPGLLTVPEINKNTLTNETSNEKESLLKEPFKLPTLGSNNTKKMKTESSSRKLPVLLPSMNPRGSPQENPSNRVKKLEFGISDHIHHRSAVQRSSIQQVWPRNMDPSQPQIMPNVPMPFLSQDTQLSTLIQSALNSFQYAPYGENQQNLGPSPLINEMASIFNLPVNDNQFWQRSNSLPQLHVPPTGSSNSIISHHMSVDGTQSMEDTTEPLSNDVLETERLKLMLDLSTIRRRQCPICGKIVTRVNSLQTHMLIHSGYRPYKCKWPACEKMFNVKSNMNRHYKIHLKKNWGNKKTRKELKRNDDV